MNTETEQYIKIGINILMKQAHNTAVSKGWWEEERNDGEAIALMHSELSEALEIMREKRCDWTRELDDKDLVAEEFADCIIRIVDYCQGKAIDLPKALIKKMKYNEQREYKHGGKKF